jgi:hypothetical protein
MSNRLEKEIQYEVRLALGTQPGCVFYRNNVGQAQFISPDGRVSNVKYGLCEGSSDIIGYVSVLVTPEMVGKTIARFVAFELKKPGAGTEKKRRELQQMFRDLVSRHGGYAEVLTDPQQTLPALARARRL